MYLDLWMNKIKCQSDFIFPRIVSSKKESQQQLILVYFF
jgi:hypothetical protein